MYPAVCPTLPVPAALPMEWEMGAGNGATSCSLPGHEWGSTPSPGHGPFVAGCAVREQPSLSLSCHKEEVCYQKCPWHCHPPLSM